MKITILEPGPDEEDELIVKIRDLDEDTLKLIKRIKDGDNRDSIAAYKDDNIVMLPLKDILYFDSVDSRVFAYTKDKTFEVRRKLFELEEDYTRTSFLRISKNAIVNIRQIERLIPEFNGRYEARLKNGESIMISRGYVPMLKRKLGIGK